MSPGSITLAKTVALCTVYPFDAGSSWQIESWMVPAVSLFKKPIIV